ncbi:hypothetical protein ACFIPR_003216 [Enterobacter kobei]
MKYTVLNDNPQNFKVTYYIGEYEQVAHFQADVKRYGSVIPGNTWVRIAKHQNATRNVYGRIYGGGSEITQHTMNEEELFQNSLIDPLTYQKRIAGLLIEAFYANQKVMTVEIIEAVLNKEE